MLNQKDIKYRNGMNRCAFRKITGSVSMRDRRGFDQGMETRYKATVLTAGDGTEI